MAAIESSSISNHEAIKVTSTIDTSTMDASTNSPPPSPPTVSVITEDIIPVPPSVPSSGISIQAHKLWVGNLDKRLTQQNILRFSSPYGRIVSFKYMCHTSGVDKGEPRGYCFMEYSTREEAERAKQAMNGKVALGRSIIVDWARPDQYLKKIGSTVSQTWDASTVSATLQGGASTAAKIAALEAKLLQMDKGDTSTSNNNSSSSSTSSHIKKSHHQYYGYYSQEHVRRKHGRNIKIQRPQKINHSRTDSMHS